MFLIKEVDSKYIDSFLSDISKEMKVRKDLLEVLYKYFNTDFFYILSCFEKLNIKFLSVEKINDIILKIEIKDLLEKNKYKDKDLDKKILFIKERYNISLNKIIKILKEIK